jgi:hypothetical protein
MRLEALPHRRAGIADEEQSSAEPLLRVGQKTAAQDQTVRREAVFQGSEDGLFHAAVTSPLWLPSARIGAAELEADRAGMIGVPTGPKTGLFQDANRRRQLRQRLRQNRLDARIGKGEGDHAERRFGAKALAAEGARHGIAQHDCAVLGGPKKPPTPTSRRGRSARK